PSAWVRRQPMVDANPIAWRRAAGIVERGIDDALYLAETEGEAIYHLNPTGAALWRLLADTVTLDEAIDLFHQAFPERARGDIEAELGKLIKALAKRGLVTEVA
ncbi:MAG: PqqD family protein, partial [Alphaproteobacteria bacterium]